MTAARRREGRVVRLRRAHELDEREHRDGVEEVHPDDALRVLELGPHLGDGERGRVRREDALRGDDLLELREDLLLHRHLLEHRLQHEVAAREDVPACAAGDERAEEARLALAEPAPADEVAQLVLNPRDRLVHLLLRQVAEDDRDLEPAEHEQRELPRHQPGADDADALHAARLGLGDPDSPLRAPLDEVERVDRGLRGGAGQELRERVLLGAVALFERPRRRAFDQVERAVRRGSRSVHLAVETRAGLADDLGRVREVGGRAALARAFLDLLEQQRQRLVEELDRLVERVREAGLERLLRVQHPVLAERVLDDELHRLLRPDELRDELRAAPARDQAEEHLGAGEVPDVGGDRAVVAVERDLDPAAERGAVDRGERDERKVADAAEELVPGHATFAGALRRDLAELADVRADREDERLSREQKPAPVAGPELAEGLLERAQRFFAERVRLPPVLAVVHGHERDRAGARLDPLELELRRRVSHCLCACSGRSPRGLLRPCRGRCRAPSVRSGHRVARGIRARAAP